MAERGEEGRESVPGLEGVSQFRGPQGSQEEGVICSKSRFERRVGQENDRGCAWSCGGTELGCRGGRPDPGGAGSHFQRGGRAHALEGPKDRPSLPPLPCPPFQGMQGMSPLHSPHHPSSFLPQSLPPGFLSGVQTCLETVTCRQTALCAAQGRPGWRQSPATCGSGRSAGVPLPYATMQVVLSGAVPRGHRDFNVALDSLQSNRSLRKNVLVETRCSAHHASVHWSLPFL